MSPLNRRDVLRISALASAGALAASRFSQPLQASAQQGAMPKGFLWGAAVAGHQVEGNNVSSDCWLLEHLSPSIFKEPSGDACDHYHLFEQDIAMLSHLGLNTFRFSIEWSRIEPEEGYFSLAELNHYRRVLEVCHQYGVTPVVTYNHAAAPRWLAYRGGWTAPNAPELFARYSERATRHLGDLIAYASTLNEPDLPMLFRWIQVPGIGVLARLNAMQLTQVRKQLNAPAFSCYFLGDPDQMRDAMMIAHTKAKAAIKSVRPTLPVGFTLALEDDQPAPTDSHVEEKRRQVYQPWLELAKSDDYLGVQTYTRERVGSVNLPPPAGAEVTQNGNEFYPEALEHAIRYASKETGVPILVTENGIATADDSRRIEYINRAVAGVRRCLADNIPVKGYLYWSLLDNFEWIFGYADTFGIVAVDRSTFQRTLKPSAHYLGSLAKGG